MKLPDNRAARSRKIKEQNLLRVYRYYSANTDARIIDVADALGLHANTVWRMRKEIVAGWTPKKIGVNL